MHTEPQRTVSCLSCSLKVVTEGEWGDAQLRTFGEKMKKCWRDEPEQCCPWFFGISVVGFHLGQLEGSLGCGCCSGGIERMLHGYCPAVDDKAFAVGRKKGSGWCFMTDLIVGYSTCVRRVGKEGLLPREANFCKSQSCRNTWCFSWTGKELEKPIGGLPQVKNLFV